MKTVMKKMFCLLLVAVLLVSAVPAAFADVASTVACTDHPDLTATYVSTSVEPTCTTTGTAIYHCNAPNGEPAHDIEVEIPKLGHSWTAEVKKEATCSETGLKVHTCVRGCTENETLPINPNNHTYVKGICTGCGLCQNCKQTPCICCDKCSGTTAKHAENCPTLLCDKGCGAAKHEGACCSECNQYGHQKAACPNLYETCCNVAKGAAHRADCVTKCTRAYNCTNANHYSDCKHALCDIEGCKLNEGHTGEHEGVLCNANNQCTKWLGHDGKHSYQCPVSGCDKAVGHDGKHSNESAYQNGSSKVKVYVNLYTSDVKTETKHLYTYENVSKDTPVYAFIAEQSEHIRSLLPSGYTWGGNVYDSQNDDDAELMKGKVGSGTTVHINAYSAQDLVYIYVHNSRSFSNLRIVQLHGKKVGETITKQEVTKAVSKYFNVSGLSMYDEQAWEDYVDGASVESVASLKITSDPYFIDVRISGTAKSGTSGSGYTADSSNPKTGDAIFAPVMILGLSASALAVLFYLNKKRAF